MPALGVSVYILSRHTRRPSRFTLVSRFSAKASETRVVTRTRHVSTKRTFVISFNRFRVNAIERGRQIARRISGM